MIFFEEKENIGGLFTYVASEKALAKHWLSKKEDKMWESIKKICEVKDQKYREVIVKIKDVISK